MRPARPRDLSALVRGELVEWRAERRYAVPRWMIEEATDRRLAGDFRGACEAAAMTLDLPRQRLSPPMTADLRHLAPDLLRWHVPRRTAAFGSALVGVLSRYDDGVALYASWPEPWKAQAVRLRLRRLERDRATFDVPRWQWDVRAVERMRYESGGDDRRIPFFQPDGTPRRPDEVAGPDDPVARLERSTMLWDAGRVLEALALHGFRATGTDPEPWQRPAPLHPGRLAALLRAGTGRFVVPGARPLGITVGGGGAVTVPSTEWYPSERVPAHLVCYPVDVDLLRFGLLDPSELHPLVGSALFPERGPRPDDGPRPPVGPEPVPVRCRGEWHLVSPGPGGLHIPHTDDEVHQEQVLEALGGRLIGCFQAQRAWAGGPGWLPKKLRLLRQDVFRRAWHGDAPGVVTLLDAGLDPGIRAGDGSTLRDYLPRLELRPGGAAAVRARLAPTAA